MYLPIFGLSVGVGDGEALGVGDGIAIAPINGSYFGVGVAKGMAIHLAMFDYRPIRERMNNPLNTLIRKAPTAAAKVLILFFALAQPTGQSCVRIEPSGR